MQDCKGLWVTANDTIDRCNVVNIVEFQFFLVPSIPIPLFTADATRIIMLEIFATGFQWAQGYLILKRSIGSLRFAEFAERIILSRNILIVSSQHYTINVLVQCAWQADKQLGFASVVLCPNHTDWPMVRCHP